MTNQAVNQYQHILLATDLASNDVTLRDKASALCQQFGAKLSIVHVIEHIPSVLDFYGYFADTDLSTKMHATANKMMFDLSKKMHVAPEQLYIKMGTPKVEIVKLANEQHVDLIIVGTHTRHGIEKMLGSTASAILQMAQCDVLTVCYNPHFD